MEKFKTEAGIKFLKANVDTEITGVKGHLYQIIAVRLLGMQVCSTIPPENISDLDLLEKQVNIDYECGTTRGWVIEMEDPAPVPCNDIKGRHHYILMA